MSRPMLTLTFAGLLAGCGSPEPRSVAVADAPPEAPARTTRPTGPLDACAVLTRADVAGVVGSEPRKPKPAEPSPQLPGSEMVGSTCQYRGEGWQLRFFVERGHTEESKKVVRRTLKNWERVDGVGDEAYWGQSDPAKPGTMSVFDGTHALVLNWFIRGGQVGPGNRDNSAKLMRKALERL